MKTETLVDYTVHYTDPVTGKARRIRARLESEVARFLKENPTAFRVDTATVVMQWLDAAPLIAPVETPDENLDVNSVL